ncbi:MAG: GAF domain-containing protein, partial [Acidobacteriaceae bacterium]|nr:GAF domain-containing protein [Acidobacteriaceae bacterium]
MPADTKLRQPFLWSALTAAAMVAALCVLCFRGIAWHQGVPVDLGWNAVPRGDQWLVTEVATKGPASKKLRPGDRIAAIDGSARAARFGPPPALVAESRSYSIDVRRDGQLMHFELPVWPIPDAAWTLYSYLLLALVNLGLAVWIGVARPDYPPARTAFFLFLATAATFAAATLDGFWPPLQGAMLWLALLVGTHVWRPLEWAVVYDFSLRFPEPLPQPRFLRIARMLFYSAGLLLFVLGVLPIIAQLLGLDARSAALPHWFPLAGFDFWRPLLNDALGAVGLLSAPLILARNYRRLPDVVARRRLRWVAVGISLAILPIAVGVALRLLLQLSGHIKAAESADRYLDTVASFASILAPITLTYAIVRHRILGIRFAIRRGIQYLLARNVLRIILYLPLIAIALDLVLHRRQPLEDFLLNKSWWFYLFVAATASVSLKYRTRMQLWVDKKFFRYAYEEEAILSELIERLHACESSREVAGILSEQLQNTLQPSTVCVLFRHKSLGKFTVGYPHDSPVALDFRGLFNDRMRDALESQRSARTISEMAVVFELQSTVASRDFGKTLVTPINGVDGGLLGVLLLGEKKSEQPYSNRDRKLLQAMATQMALVLEMLTLKEQVREEGRVRVEVLGRLEQEQ